jgi:hypothetical protein
MNILITILIAIASFIAILFIIALFLKKKHYVKREIIINASSQNIYDFLRFLKNQELFNNRASQGEREKNFTGNDGTVGFTYAWKGDKSAGEGEKEIMNLVEGKKVEMEIRFIKPMKVSSQIVMEIESLSPTSSKISWSNSGVINPPFNILIPMMEKGLPKEMDASLQNLKTILEK